MHAGGLLYLAETHSTVGDIFANRYIFLLIGALVGFFSSYLMELIKARRLPKKELTWDLGTKAWRLDQEDGAGKVVQVAYRGQAVDNLVTRTLRFTNTGNTTIRNQLLRLELPESAKLLDIQCSPTPPPEFEVEDITESEQSSSGRSYKVGQLDPSQCVSFVINADGGDWTGWSGVHLKNREQEVKYQERAAARARADQEHVAPFVILLTLFVMDMILSIGFADLIFNAAVELIGIILGLLVLRHLSATARVISSALTRRKETDQVNYYTANKGGSIALTDYGLINVYPKDQADSNGLVGGQRSDYADSPDWTTESDPSVATGIDHRNLDGSTR